MTPSGRLLLFVALPSILIAGGLITIVKVAPEPPAEEMEFARSALAEARDSKAETYTPNTYRLAMSYYDSAMVHWKSQNEKFILLRNYDEVIRFSRVSSDYSSKAIEQTRKSASTLRSRLGVQIKELKGIVSGLNTLYTRYPLSSEIRNRISKGKLYLSEAVIAFDNGAYTQANRKVTDADHHLRYAWEQANGSISDYFGSYQQWITWKNKTIAESRQKGIAVVLVDKFAAKCYLYQKGVKTMEFDAELGVQWIGDKRHRGDKATPEGMYHVTRKLEGGSTKYYKALLINYPNDDDTRRFKAEIANGTLPSNAKIGGLIEIHGHGGRGTDWTDGCVALTDSDMDKIYRLVKVGTPVTIIGSEVPLSEILSRHDGAID
ncbi:MAG: L,D-transpeptidase family protein [Bacteroidales bacterium]|nr:L,D-transpeptidase family protein [Bacteroidales bacterium]